MENSVGDTTTYAAGQAEGLSHMVAVLGRSGESWTGGEFQFLERRILLSKEFL
jgi:hypothetical protein